MFEKQTPEEKAERALVSRNIWTKTLGSATALAVVVFFISVAADHAILAFIFAPITFVVGALLGALIFSSVENDQSRLRLAKSAEQRQLALEEEAKTATMRRQQQDAERLEELARARKREDEAHLAQKRRDDREYVLRKLSSANVFIDLYDSENADRGALVKQNISKELSEIMVRHTHQELTVLIAGEPDVRGMIVLLDKNLKSKGIESPEAEQIAAAAQNSNPT